MEVACQFGAGHSPVECRPLGEGTDKDGTKQRAVVIRTMGIWQQNAHSPPWSWTEEGYFAKPAPGAESCMCLGSSSRHFRLLVTRRTDTLCGLSTAPLALAGSGTYVDMCSKKGREDGPSLTQPATDGQARSRFCFSAISPMQVSQVARWRVRRSPGPSSAKKRRY